MDSTRVKNRSCAVCGARLTAGDPAPDDKCLPCACKAAGVEMLPVQDTMSDMEKHRLQGTEQDARRGFAHFDPKGRF